MIGERLRPFLLAAGVGLLAFPLGAEQPAPDGWRPFTATWTLSGQRHQLPTEGEQPASIVHLTGPFVLTSGEGLGKGLLGEVIGFDDGGGLFAGRVLFTDEHGDHVFGRLEAQPIGEGRRATATITGGTGRFSGLKGSFTFAWQYVVSQGTDEISGRAVDLSGKTRFSGKGAPPEKP